MMRTKNGRPLCTAHLWSDSFDVTISGNDHVQFNVMQCAWTGRGGVKWDLSPLLAHPLWVSLRPVKLIKMFRCGRFFPHLRPARWTRSILWNGNPNYGLWSWHKATCYFRGLLKTASSTASFGTTSPRGRVPTNTSKFVKVIASVECDLGILATLTRAWMLLSLTSFIFGLKKVCKSILHLVVAKLF